MIDFTTKGAIKVYGSEHHTFGNQSKFVGYYALDNNGPFHFYFTDKPHWWHRFWAKVFLDWVWVDTK